MHKLKDTKVMIVILKVLFIVFSSMYENNQKGHEI